MMKIKSEEWKPVGGLKLEDNALKTVQENRQNCLVQAGPGAGKTELLAQRACFLLQTNTCQYPKKILAISFKRDAAFNLSERVKKRCSKDLASRFTSLTFDTFAKSILDRFMSSLPQRYKVPNDYDILLNYNDIEDTYRRLNPTFGNSNKKQSLIKFLTEYSLPLDESPIDTKGQQVNLVWNHYLQKGKSRLSFAMISRLAELIFKINPQLKKYLNLTYSHIFLDEFQDTTSIQYDLLKTCFLDTDTVITAVGDNKQRIMLWAGAKKDIFDAYQNEFASTNFQLLMNYRSAPKIIELQKILMSDLMETNENIQSSDKWNEEDGNIEFWFFNSDSDEASIAASQIKDLIISKGIPTNEICILVKQQVDKYAIKIINELNLVDIKARNEQTYQDFLSEDLVLYIINMIKVSFDEKCIEEYDFVFGFISKIISLNDDEKKLKEETKLKLFIQELKSQKLPKINEDEDLEVIIDEIIDYLGIKKISSFYPQYKNRSWIRDIKKALSKMLWNEYIETKSWIKTIDSFKGKYSIPIMTIHKSKGLEYNTVIFLGLEDRAFWNFSNQPEEDTCAFFVAMSRAKENLIFTFSKNRHSRSQSTGGIQTLYGVLKKYKLIEFKDFTKD